MDLSQDGLQGAFGVPSGPQLGFEVGAVYALTNFGTPQEQEHVLLPSIPTPQRRFGSSLAMSANGSVLVGGAPGVVFGGVGRAFVFRFDGNTWVEERVLTSPYYDRLAYTVDMSDDGNVIVVGAPDRSPGGQHYPGAVDIYRYDGLSWVLGHSIYPTASNFSLALGLSLSLSGDGRFLAVRGRVSVSSNPSSVVQIYENVGASWVQCAELTDPTGWTNPGFGMALDFDAHGETLAVGDSGDSRLVYSQGAATIFRRTSSTWNYHSLLLPSTPTSSGSFGFHLALNSAGDRVIVGAPAQSYGGYAGVVEEFELLSSGANRIAVHQGPPFADQGQFGRCVAMNATGDRWVASKHLADTYGPNFGEIHLFEATCLTPQVYCTAQANTLGCVPAVAALGTASVSAAGGFVISVSQVRNRQNGMLLYGTSGRASLPWHGGTLCVAPPLRRTPVLNSLGAAAPTNDCSGVLARDFNAWAVSANDPGLFAGQHVRAQFYSRDPGAPGNLNLSDALEFYLEP